MIYTGCPFSVSPRYCNDEGFLWINPKICGGKIFILYADLELKKISPLRGFTPNQRSPCPKG